MQDKSEPTGQSASEDMPVQEIIQEPDSQAKAQEVILGRGDSQLEIERKDMRGFSQLTEPELRDRLAKEIKESRKLRVQLLSESGKLSERKKALQEVEENLAEMEESLASLSTNFAVRILNWRKRTEVTAQILEMQMGRELTQAEVRNNEATVDELAAVLQGRKDAEEDKKLIDKFYSGTKEKYLESKRVRQVKNVMEKHNVLFVHGFSEYVPQGNSVLWEDGRVDFEMKLRILLALSPDISTSTVQKGSGKKNIWETAGVVLSGGEVEFASSSDAGTIAAPNSNHRQILGGVKEFHKNPEEAISTAVKNTGYYHNEFVVREPEVAFVYFFQEKEKKAVDRKYYDNLVQIGERYGLPVYCLNHGELHDFAIEQEEHVDPIDGRHIKYDALKIGKKIDKEELKGKRGMSDDEKKKIFEGIFKDQPFDPEKLGIKEAEWMNESEVGKERFSYAHALEHPNDGKEATYKLWPNQYESLNEHERIPDGAKIKVVGDNFINGMRFETFNYSGQAFLRVKPRNSMKGSESVHIQNLSDYAKQYPDDIPSKEKFLAGQKKDIEWGMKSAQSAVNSLNTLHARNYLKNRAFNLFGFSLEAQRLGDFQIAAEARELAESANVLTWNEYIGIHDRRMKNGSFVVKPEDMKVSNK